MIFDMKAIYKVGLFAAALAANGIAAPKLQLPSMPLAVVTVAAGANGTATVEAKNAGDGSLALQATSTATWLIPTVGAARACADGSGPGCVPIQLALQTAALARGSYSALLVLNDPNAVDAPQSLAVTVQIVAGVPDQFDITVVAGSSLDTRFSTTGPTTVMASSTAKFLSAVQDGGSPFSPTIPYKVSVSAATLAVGDYTGSITVSGSTTAAENKTSPVTVHVVKNPIAGPLANIGGALNNTTYAVGEPLAVGDIVALFGAQFVTGDPAAASSLPLPTTLGAVQVFYNDKAVPLYYVSAGQINLQLPFEATMGEGRLRVESNGVKGNTISVVAARAVPRILRLNGNFGDYGIITNPDNSLPIPASLGGIPAKLGAALVIYTIGMGPTTPAVASGVGSPTAEPLARVGSHPQVCFRASTPFNPGLCVDPLFAGLAPGFVGLYQVNVVIPATSPTGNIVPIYLKTDDGNSNTVNLAIQ